MPVIISLINLKGGVGKTTLTVALGEFMAVEHGLKVLIIDLDPQTNSTVALINEHDWKKRNIKGQTVLQVFRDRLEHMNIFSADEAIAKNVSNVGGGISGLDLLPSSLDLIDVQDELINISSRGILSERPLTILGEAVAEKFNDYDVILIDCPPNLGIITQNGLVLSQYYIIPVIPDVLSTYGIPQIVNRIERLKRETAINLEPLGLVINKYRQQNSLHPNQLRILRLGAKKAGYRRVFATIIPENSKAAAAMDFSLKPASLHEKYGYDIPYKQYQQFTQEVLDYVSR